MILRRSAAGNGDGPGGGVGCVLKRGLNEAGDSWIQCAGRAARGCRPTGLAVKIASPQGQQCSRRSAQLANNKAARAAPRSGSRWPTVVPVTSLEQLGNRTANPTATSFDLRRLRLRFSRRADDVHSLSSAFLRRSLLLPRARLPAHPTPSPCLLSLVCLPLLTAA